MYNRSRNNAVRLGPGEGAHPPQPPEADAHEATDQTVGRFHQITGR